MSAAKQPSQPDPEVCPTAGCQSRPTNEELRELGVADCPEHGRWYFLVPVGKGSS